MVVLIFFSRLPSLHVMNGGGGGSVYTLCVPFRNAKTILIAKVNN